MHGGILFLSSENRIDVIILLCFVQSRYGLPAGASREALARVLSRLPGLGAGGVAEGATRDPSPLRGEPQRPPSSAPTREYDEDTGNGVESGEGGSLAELLRSLGAAQPRRGTNEGHSRAAAGRQNATARSSTPPQMRRPQTAADYDRLLMVCENHHRQQLNLFSVIRTASSRLARYNLLN